MRTLLTTAPSVPKTVRTIDPYKLSFNLRRTLFAPSDEPNFYLVRRS
jgi:hypothetical protein